MQCSGLCQAQAAPRHSFAIFLVAKTIANIVADGDVVVVFDYLTLWFLLEMLLLMDMDCCEQQNSDHNK